MVGIYQSNPATIEEDKSSRYRHFKTRTQGVSSFSITIMSKIGTERKTFVSVHLDKDVKEIQQNEIDPNAF